MERIGRFEIVRQRYGVAILRDTENPQQYRTIGVSEKNAQVYSLGSDSPTGGGQWFSHMTEAGVEYVSSPRSRSSAYHVFAEAVEV